jgi:hypothetical protein
MLEHVGDTPNPSAVGQKSTVVVEQSSCNELTTKQ